MTLNDRCFSCMNIIPAGHSVCPSCGYYTNPAAAEKDALSEGSILAARYLVGRVLSRTDSVIRYIGFDYDQNRKVIIEEQFFRDVFSREECGDICFLGRDAAAVELARSTQISSACRVSKIGKIAGVVEILHVFEENGTVYTVLEWVNGQPLSMVGVKDCDLDMALDFLRPVVEGLRSLHQKGIFHGDLSPDSIYVTSQGKTVLVGIGTGAASFRRKRSDQRGEVTRSYAAPETQVDTFGEPGVATDIYGFSAIVYELVTGVKPNPLKLVPAENINGISARQSAMLVTGLSLSPAKRPKTLQAMLKGLIGSNNPACDKKGKAIKRTSWRFRFSIGAALVALGVLLVLFAPRPNIPESGAINELMPSLTGMNIEDAQQLLNERFDGQIEITIAGKEWDEAIEANTIVRQEPEAGSPIRDGDVVYVYISRGHEADIDTPVNLRMPDLLAENEEYAVSLLEKYGIIVSIKREYSTMFANGLVIAQSPEPGKNLSEGMTVTLTISRGLEPGQEHSASGNPSAEKPAEPDGDKPGDGATDDNVGIITSGNAACG